MGPFVKTNQLKYDEIEDAFFDDEIDEDDEFPEEDSDDLDDFDDDL